MGNNQIKHALEDNGGWLTGHFELTGGNHTDTYINKDALYPHVRLASQLGEAMALCCAAWQPQVVVSPALGGIVLVQWTAHHLTNMYSHEVLAVPAEKRPGRGFVFTRGYDELVRGRRVVVLEDNLTTGASVREVVELIRATSGTVVGVVAMLNRGGVSLGDVGNPPHLTCLIEADLPSWPPADCPLCAADKPVDQRVGHGRK